MKSRPVKQVYNQHFRVKLLQVVSKAKIQNFCNFVKTSTLTTLSQPVCFLPLCPLNGQRNCLRRLQKPSETKPSKVLVYSALPEKFGNLKNSDVSRGPVAVHKIHALNPCMHFNNRVTPVPYRNGTRT